MFDARVAQNLLEALGDLDDAIQLLSKHSMMDSSQVQVAHARGLLRSTYTMIRPGAELEEVDGEYVPITKTSIKKVLRNILP